MSTEAVVPEIGVHRGIPYAEYDAWKAINNGTLAWMDTSPKHMLSAFEKKLKGKDSDARRFGREFHCRLLEPELFPIKVLSATACTGKKGDGVVCGKTAKYLVGDQWRCGTHSKDGEREEPSEYVTADELKRIDAMIAAIGDHKAMRVMKQFGGCEVSIVAEIEGVLCKVRVAKLIDNPPFVVDIKKAGRGITYEACLSAIEGGRYDRQMSIYRTAAEEALSVPHGGIWVFIEDTYPHDCVVIQQDDECHRFALDGEVTEPNGMLNCIDPHSNVRSILRRWKSCVETGVFPGVCEEIAHGGTRPYFRERIRRRMRL